MHAIVLFFVLSGTVSRPSNLYGWIRSRMALIKGCVRVALSASLSAAAAPLRLFPCCVAPRLRSPRSLVLRVVPASARPASIAAFTVAVLASRSLARVPFVITTQVYGRTAGLPGFF